MQIPFLRTTDPTVRTGSVRPVLPRGPVPSAGRWRRRVLRRSAAALTVLGALFPVVAASAPEDHVPRTATSGAEAHAGHSRWKRAFLASVDHPDASPRGADDWSCVPGARHPRPVVLVHGTYENASSNWSGLSPRLAAEGYCVFAVNFGAPRGAVVKGRAAVPESAEEVARFVDRVLDRTGARQVDVVGHSQGGGILPRYYLKFAGGTDPSDPARNKVHHLIGISPANHGSTVSGLATLAQRLRVLAPAAAFGGQALADQTIGSAVNRRLDAGGDTMPGVRYTTVVTRSDRIVTPYERQYLHPGDLAGQVTNITVQDLCPAARTGHMDTPYDPVVLRLVAHALDPATAREPGCGHASAVSGRAADVRRPPGGR
ncbi:esterase/lipase family protein [Streptomyces sp. NPDC102282]|uniref:esterase/lipase family protein n=1 Tax=Streptomyces sp. NPDC102282 TaxID=3366154 RepID=UPI0037F58E9B